MKTETRTAMKLRFVTTILASVVSVALASWEKTAQGQEIQLTGPLKGAPAVRHLRLYRQGRFEIAPAVSFTLLDQYRRTILVGARLNYNFTDWLAFGVWGAYAPDAFITTTDLSDQIDQKAPRDALTAVNVNHTGSYPNYGAAAFQDQLAKYNWVIAPQFTLTPFRGKLAIFNKIFVDTDFYVTAGIGIVGVQERANCGGGGSEPACSDPTSFTLQSTTKVSYGTFGVGLTFYPGGFWSLGVEYRALPFAWNLSGFDSSGGGPSKQFPDTKVNGDDETFHFNQLVTITVGFSFPTKPKITE
jgi:outer membrane beta-barrel protein